MQRAIGVLFFFVGLVFIGEKLAPLAGVSLHLELHHVVGWAVVLMGAVTFVINSLALFHLRKLFTTSGTAEVDTFARGQLENYGGLVVFSIASMAIGASISIQENLSWGQVAGALLLFYGSSATVQLLRKQQTAELLAAAGHDPESGRTVRLITVIGTVGAGIYLFFVRG